MHIRQFDSQLTICTYTQIYIYLVRGYRVTSFISPPVSKLNVPYRLRVDRISLKRSRRIIRSILGRYGTLSLDTGGDMKKGTR